jgi:hypothetical protein
VFVVAAVIVVSLSTQSGNFWIHPRIGGLDLYLHSFLISALEGSEWSASRPGSFTPGEIPRYPLDKRLDGLQIRSGRRGEDAEPLVRMGGPQRRSGRDDVEASRKMTKKI